MVVLSVPHIWLILNVREGKMKEIYCKVNEAPRDITNCDDKKFNPDYLDFANGVYAGRVLENERIRKKIQLIGTYWLRHDNVEGFSMTKEEFEQALKLEVESDIEL